MLLTVAILASLYKKRSNNLSIYVRRPRDMALYEKITNYILVLFDTKLNCDYGAASVKKLFHAVIYVENLYCVNKT